MGSSIISVRLSDSLLKRMDEVTDNRTGFIKEAIKDKLNGKRDLSPELTDGEKRVVLKEAKNLSEIMKEAMLQRLSRERDLLDTMPREDFLKLVAGRLPKEEVPDVELEQDVLSLRRCLDGLPAMNDICGELRKVKGELHKAELELDLHKRLLRHTNGKEDAREFMEGVYRGVVRYVCELVARNSLPGLGDGGGLTETGYQEISNQVKRDLEILEIYRKK